MVSKDDKIFLSPESESECVVQQGLLNIDNNDTWTNCILEKDKFLSKNENGKLTNIILTKNILQVESRGRTEFEITVKQNDGSKKNLKFKAKNLDESDDWKFSFRSVLPSPSNIGKSSPSLRSARTPPGILKSPYQKTERLTALPRLFADGKNSDVNTD